MPDTKARLINTNGLITAQKCGKSKAQLESRYESRLNQLQQLNESLDASEMIESHEAEIDKLRTTQVKRK